MQTISVCEAANSTTCPYFKSNGSAFTCMAACDSINKYNLSDLCVTTCRTTSNSFLSTDGVNCVASCSFGYQIYGSELQCVTVCPWPNALYINTTYSSTINFCSASCPTNDYLNRADQNCVSSCSYLNATLITGNTVCEVADNATNCPYYVANSTWFTCLASCSGFTVG
jgi:hypothetical protein